ncbi:hypothetical protein [Pedococcus bigeumensis]|uniref:Uncharacterized protein n=1 Tax=Pedococcus bigeumensis TaxID=433644 RepID=A0A502CIK6_9MICO|nr:hypothetical protein [Pedococcus bigeumensis]TPG12562.1 hypothetical protein EAH86_19855 [Pedococcus bigeumensis]
MSSAADEFAAILGVTAPTSEPEPVEPVRRRPRPDPSQASGANGPTAVNPSARFAEWMEDNNRRGDGKGNWRQVGP